MKRGPCCCEAREKMMNRKVHSGCCPLTTLPFRANYGIDERHFLFFLRFFLPPPLLLSPCTAVASLSSPVELAAAAFAATASPPFKSNFFVKSIARESSSQPSAAYLFLMPSSSRPWTCLLYTSPSPRGRG